MSSELTSNTSSDNKKNQLIFEHSVSGRINGTQMVDEITTVTEIPDNLLRKTKPMLPEVSEMDAIRHYTRLSQKNFSIDTHFYHIFISYFCIMLVAICHEITINFKMA